MSQRRSGYARKAHDLYETPAWVTDVVARHLIETERVNPVRARVLEPAAGNGQMVRQLKANGFRSIATADIEPRPGLDVVEDFRTLAPNMLDVHRAHPEHLPTLVATNPPYTKGLVEEFIRHALALTRPQLGCVAMLLKVDFDSGKTRSAIFRDHPAWGTKIVLQDRITWFAESEGADPSVNHAWYVWNWRRMARTGAARHPRDLLYASRTDAGAPA